MWTHAYTTHKILRYFLKGDMLILNCKISRETRDRELQISFVANEMKETFQLPSRFHHLTLGLASLALFKCRICIQEIKWIGDHKAYKVRLTFSLFEFIKFLHFSLHLNFLNETK